MRRLLGGNGEAMARHARQPRQQGFCGASFHACLGVENAIEALP
jgi:hypothetical protein